VAPALSSEPHRADGGSELRVRAIVGRGSAPSTTLLRMVLAPRFSFRAALFFAAAVAGCARSSAPPPAADPVTSPSPPTSSTTAMPEPTAASPSSTASTAPAPSSTPSSQPTTASECASADKSPRERATCEAKEEFGAFVATHQSCTTAADCTIVTGSCPFGCFVPVTKASREATVAKLSALGDKLDKEGNRCVYRCMSPPVEACVEGRCVTGPR
jgi:hypothetical protein